MPRPKRIHSPSGYDAYMSPSAAGAARAVVVVRCCWRCEPARRDSELGVPPVSRLNQKH